MSLLEVQAIHKRYAAHEVLRGVSVAAEERAIVALLGPSGCGKTTLLRILAGLETPDSGTIYFAGQRIDGVPTHKRHFGLMFQDYALFPHKDVYENVAFGLYPQRLPQPQIRARVAAMLELVGLPGYERRRVYALSGGERQRVALARSLAPEPRLLMLDEPLAALDRALRERLQEELGSILRAVGLTSVYVTHDQQEAFALADQVVLMNNGLVMQCGSPEQVYRQPANRWVAGFLGLGALLAGQLRPDGAIETAVGLFAPPATMRLPANGPLTLLIRPTAALEQAAPGTPQIAGRVSRISFRGSHYRVELRHASGSELAFDLKQPPAAVGELATIAIDPAELFVFYE